MSGAVYVPRISMSCVYVVVGARRWLMVTYIIDDIIIINAHRKLFFYTEYIGIVVLYGMLDDACVIEGGRLFNNSPTINYLLVNGRSRGKDIQ
jgi:hypothetical protein